MKLTLTGLLLGGVTCALAMAAPAVAQVASSPGHPKKHAYSSTATPEVYQATSGGVGALGPLNAMVGAPSGGSCGVVLDATNGRETALCGL
jgi:hypothetical protein